MKVHDHMEALLCAQTGSRLMCSLLTCVQVNTEIVQIQRVQTAAGQAQLKALIQAHVDATQSSKGAAILGDWNNQLPKFWQLVPPSEVRLLA